MKTFVFTAALSLAIGLMAPWGDVGAAEQALLAVDGDDVRVGVEVGIEGGDAVPEAGSKCDPGAEVDRRDGNDKRIPQAKIADRLKSAINAQSGSTDVTASLTTLYANTAATGDTADGLDTVFTFDLNGVGITATVTDGANATATADAIVAAVNAASDAQEGQGPPQRDAHHGQQPDGQRGQRPEPDLSWA